MKYMYLYFFKLPFVAPESCSLVNSISGTRSSVNYIKATRYSNVVFYIFTNFRDRKSAFMNTCDWMKQ
jgi:hypothetical protein